MPSSFARSSLVWKYSFSPWALTSFRFNQGSMDLYWL
eukprot:CAMPEP_0117606976 /NCGR_PEP_ID=MMETSP0784-20121206/79995_1 /TAXON_ID=39447 /ORGANISM="" /LENGTH=36 /DNA_ID= /DNA_START= /DNA_END= /DNA_ORIENTATION=